MNAVERIGGEAVAALYRVTVPAVGAASLASVILSATMVGLGASPPGRGIAFSAYICTCAAIHVGLRSLFWRSASQVSHWRSWGMAYAACCFLEGLGWGWAPVRLVADANIEVELLCLVVTLGVVAGAVPAFGPYRPAYVAFVVPVALPYVAQSALSGVPIRQVTTCFMVLYVAAITMIGFILHRAFVEQILARFRSEQLAEELKLQVVVTEAANRAKSSFLAAASHDLRQPVHALTLFVGAIQRTALPEEARTIIGHIERSTQALDSLFASILDISRLDAGTVEVDRQVFALGPILTRLGEECAVSATTKGIALRVRLPRNPILLDTDPLLVERILRNIVENGVNYTDRGGVLIAARRRRDHCLVQVWDTGAGIGANEQDKIFQEYYQVGNLERDRTKGLGLGLAIVRRLTALLACKLVLRSQLGRGSVFGLELPLAGAGAAESGQAETLAAIAAGTLFIVVIDDEAEIRAAMTMILAKWGHLVIAVGSGEEALATLADRPETPELIIADFRLRDGESGIDAVETLRAEYNTTIPAILITGDTAPDRLIEASAGGLPLLHKPVSSARLRTAMIRACGVGET